VTFAEDSSQIRTGAAAQVMACLRNLAIGALSRDGRVDLAAASVTTAATYLPLATLGVTPLTPSVGHRRRLHRRQRPHRMRKVGGGI
jgi:hypothetical protein